ncbi:MAG: mandelate racemase/muconate lactonizing protein [Herbinix sp.]|jgi:L-alanine-DL-glutamate epimerase-like enolase superfamily enzyme|nr:mandelate racemase/muconate lactonizing protein [Herbinix sp.]
MELAYHKIIEINNKRARNRYPRLYGKNSRLPEHSYGGDCYLVEIKTDKGASGWGLGRCNEEIKLKMIGKSVSEVFDPNIGILSPDARCLDFALHDLAGKILKLPVSKMMCDTPLASVNCYDGAIYMNDISPDTRPGGIDAILENCRYDYYELGYHWFKIKVGRSGKWMEYNEGLKRDIDVVRAIHKEFPDAILLVDANDAYTTDSLFKFLDGVIDCNIYWIEEPFQESVEGFQLLREYLAKHSPKTLIADGEFNPDLPLLMDLAQKKLIDVFLMDVEGYGFTNWRSMMKTVNELQISASPHNWGQKLKTHYSAHLAASFQGIDTIEGVPDLTEGIDFDDYQLKDGYLWVPDKYGFGMDMIWTHSIS